MPTPSPPPPLPPPPTVVKDTKAANPPPMHLQKNGVVGVLLGSPETELAPLILKALLDCARLTESEPDRVVKSLIRLKELESKHGDPTERVAFYFSEAFCNRVSHQAKKRSTMFGTSSEEFTLSYKALNNACPYLKFAHLTTAALI